MLSPLKTLLQLGIFRKTSITGQFRVDWLRSKYRGCEWGYSVDFLRVEGYKAGEPCFVIGYILFFSKVLMECCCETIFWFQEVPKKFLTPRQSSTWRSLQTSGLSQCGKLQFLCIMTKLSLNRFFPTT